jgi:hypothetical protein
VRRVAEFMSTDKVSWACSLLNLDTWFPFSPILTFHTLLFSWNPARFYQRRIHSRCSRAF